MPSSPTPQTLSNMKKIKRTKIVCTIGPACSTPAILKKMIRSGMNVARLNMSHGDYKSHSVLIRRIRTAEKSLGQPLALIGDLQGPKIRVAEMPAAGKLLIKGEVVELPVTYLDLFRDVKKGDRVLIEDGLMDGECVGGRKGFLKIKIRVGGTLLSHKGLNFPDSILKVRSLTEKDRRDAVFCLAQGVHYIAMSFVTCAADVKDLQRILKKNLKVGQACPMIIAKIEKHEAVKKFDEILKVVDAIMVARGDLGVEILAEQVPLIQKEIINKCRAVGKPVIVATQMLDSMIRNPRPTRAEVSDVANAVIDHTDAVMLSGETASGKYPVEAVATMARIIQETEDSPFDDVPIKETTHFVKIIEDAVGGAANLLSRTLKADAILVAALSDDTARLVSRFRPEMPIFAATTSEFVLRQMSLIWAVSPLIVPKSNNIDDLIAKSIGKIKKNHLIKKGGRIIVLAVKPVGKRADFVEVKEV
ncbi:MAG: Pyruvate kinase [Candidatus Uhrbacteria bacterium GW2011_GWE2_45_35]|uniref:Pyruvate kinase n=1 Tax=Candidatus Uhrbacteria bacterium GW2011_GWE2_45_35 TaxID=1618993 RepID=A0A0G1MLD6_9BACT|nr:MAG: Pyruvate kinase [Candidatus Uhrbacteria bacterium GW2011_GWE2_45_35]